MRLLKLRLPKTILSFVLSIAIAAQSLSMLTPSTAEAKLSTKAKIISCTMMLTALAGGVGGYNIAENRAQELNRPEIVLAQSPQQTLQQYGSTRLSAVIGNTTPTAAQIRELNRQMQIMAVAQTRANSEILPSDQLFLDWWRVNQDTLISTRSKAGDITVGTFFGAAVTQYVYEITEAEKNPRAYVQWYKTVASDPTAQYIAVSAWTALLNVLKFIKDIGYTVLVMSIAVGGFSAYIARGFNNPLQQKLGIMGTVKLGRFGEWFQGVLNRQKIPKELADRDPNLPDTVLSPEDMLKDEKSRVDGILKNIREDRKHSYGLGFVVDSDELLAHQNKMISTYVMFNNLWASFIGDDIRNGRALKWDALYFRMRDFANVSGAHFRGSEVWRQGLSDFKRDFIAAHPSQAGEINRLFDELTEVARDHVANQIINPALGMEKEARIKQIVAELTFLGCRHKDAQQAALNAVMMATDRQAATFNLVNYLNHEFEFREFRQVEKHIYAQILRNRHASGIDQLIIYLADDILKLSHLLEYRIEVYRNKLNAIHVLTRKDLIHSITEARNEALNVPGLTQDMPAANDSLKSRFINSFRSIFTSLFGRTPEAATQAQATDAGGVTPPPSANP